MHKLRKRQRAKADTYENVEYTLRHCADCAKGVEHCSIATQYVGREHKMPAHGVIKPMFQENGLCRFLLKKGLLSPLWVNMGLMAILLAPFLGYWSGSRSIANLVVSAGKAGIASRINGSGGEAAFTYIALGTGTTAAAAGDTTLQTELAASGLSRANATVSRVTTDVTNDTARLVNTFTVTGSAAVTESGVFNASSGGTLLARNVFSAVNVVNGDSLQITWSIDVD